MILSYVLCTSNFQFSVISLAKTSYKHFSIFVIVFSDSYSCSGKQHFDWYPKKGVCEGYLHQYSVAWYLLSQQGPEKPGGISNRYKIS